MRLPTAAEARGLVLLSGGVFGNAIRILVLLSAPDSVIDHGLDILKTTMVNVG